MTGAAPTLALALLLVQEAVPHPLPPRTEQPPGVLAVTGATFHPVSAPPIEDGVMLVEGGTILTLGADVAVPAGAHVLDLAGATVVPGLVESHSHMGFKRLFRPTTGSDNNELSKPINAEVRAVDGIAAQDPAFRVALAAGVTTMNVTTGSRSFASGQAAVLKLRGRSVEEMWLAPGGLKFAMRIRSRNQWDLPVPGILDMLRARLRDARAYAAARAAHERGEAAEAPTWDPRLEALAGALARDYPVGVHAHGVEPMRAAIALKDEFGLDLYIHHADATLDLADELAAKGIPVSFGPVLPQMGRDDPALAGPVRLAELGGSVSFHQDHPDGPQYYIRHAAALFVRQGMPEEVALGALTLEPARLFGLDDRIGSLEPGKDADFVVLDGPPLAWESRVRRVFIEGVEVYRLAGDAAGRAAASAPPDGAAPAAGDRAASPSTLPAAAARDLAVVGGEVRPVSSPPIADGVVLVSGRRIVAVGRRGEVAVPAGAVVLDATGLTVVPGFIDARTSVALPRGAAVDRAALLRSPDVRMADRLEELRVPGVFGMDAGETPAHPWVMDGVTAVYVAPGASNLVAGFGAVVKLAGERLGPVVEPAAALHLSLGEGPLRLFDGPTTRQGMVALLRQWLRRARDAGPGGDFTLGAPAAAIEGFQPGTWRVGTDLAVALAGERPVRFYAHQPDDVLAALRVAEEFGLRATIEGASGAHVVARALARSGASVVVGPAMTGGGGAPEEFAHTAENSARLSGAGVPFAFSTDGAGGRSVTVEALVARGHGLPAGSALEALTLGAARVLGVGRRLGSLEPGKDADLVLWAGDPVGTWGETRVVVVDGRVVYRREGT